LLEQFAVEMRKLAPVANVPSNFVESADNGTPNGVSIG